MLNLCLQSLFFFHISFNFYNGFDLCLEGMEQSVLLIPWDKNEISS